MKIKHVIILILLILCFIFIIQNAQNVEVQLLFWKVFMSRALMLLGTFIIGFIVGWFTKSFHYSRRK